ncbi:hypothetical protein DKX38_024736 [Salix brachista]|uniref:Uncharacterized protein n=1 Tax=Salix brachista TaxID=2182728 RepID=A0A5N5JZX5_9ROSI|nr:hypothetical protein DKX38_024736 [Salix brachista]
MLKGLDPRQLEHDGKKAKPDCKRTEHGSSPGQIQAARQPSTTSSDIMVAARQVGNSQLNVTNGENEDDGQRYMKLRDGLLAQKINLYVKTKIKMDDMQGINETFMNMGASYTASKNSPALEELFPPKGSPNFVYSIESGRERTERHALSEELNKPILLTYLVYLYPLSSLPSTTILGENEDVFMVFKGNFIFLNMFCSVERMEEKRFPNTHDGASMTLGEWIVNCNYISRLSQAVLFAAMGPQLETIFLVQSHDEVMATDQAAIYDSTAKWCGRGSQGLFA